MNVVSSRSRVLGRFPLDCTTWDSLDRHAYANKSTNTCPPPPLLSPSLLPLPPPPSSTGESAMGPVVKQIMDHPRCAQLREGDVILEVNGEKVNNYVHTDLVTVLKRCGKGNQANFTVLRQPAEVYKTQ